jgi:hypothetical protein
MDKIYCPFLEEGTYMKKILLLIGIYILPLTTVFAGATRVLDGQFITNAGSTLTLPSSNDTLVGRATTDTFTNKSLSGSSNTFTSIPVGAIGNGSVLAGSNSGDVTIGTANGLSLTGQILSLGLSSTSTTGALSSSDWNTFNGKQASLGYTPVNEAGFTAKGDLLIGTGSGTNGTLSVGSNTFILTADSTQTTGVKWAAAPSVGPVLNGTSASPQAVTVSGGVSLSGVSYFNVAFVVGSPGAVTVTATPSITACTADGQQLKVIGTDNTKTVTLQDQANLASSGLSLNGNWIGAKDSVLTLHCDITQGLWVEDSRR